MSLLPALAAAQYTIVPSAVIAKTGDAAVPGRPGSEVFAGFYQSPVVNRTGQVAFVARTVPVVGAPTGGTSIWTNRSGVLEPVAFGGDPIAPESSDPTRAWAAFSTTPYLFLADNGRLIVTGRGVPEFSSFGYTSEALLASDHGDAWSFLAVNSRVYPDSLPVPLDAWLAFPAVRVDDGRVGFPARHPNRSMYFVMEDELGRLVAAETPNLGTPTNVNPVAAIADSGDFIHTAVYSESNVRARGQIGEEGPQLTQTGQTLTFLNAPGEWVFSPADETPGPNGNGEFIIGGTLHAATGGPELGAVVRFTPQGVVLLARQGDAVSSTSTLVWSSFGTFWCHSDTGESALRASVSGPGVTDQSDSVLVRFSAGDAPQAEIIAREGDSVADLPGFAMSGTFGPTMTRTGKLRFGTSLRHPEGGFVSAMFTIDLAGRTRLLTAFWTTSIVLPSIGAVQITTVQTTGSSGGNDGLARDMTTDGQVAARVAYAGGQAIVLIPVPCPADIAGAAAAPGFDGQLDNNDFIAFIGHFFNTDPRADYGSADGVHGPDGQYDNNDFIAFIGQFFNGCS